MTIDIEIVDVYYLKPSLTIEIVLVYLSQAVRPQYRCIRNDGGVYFKVFERFEDALNEECEQAQFQSERDLDKYLRNNI